MPTDFLERCEKIEECYEFMLAYAGQGLPSDQGSHAGGQVRDFLQAAGKAMEGLAESCEAALAEDGVNLPDTAFVAVLRREALFLSLSLAQPSVQFFFFDRVTAGTYSPRNSCLQEHVENRRATGRFPSMEGECF
jgi:hypothetical protein